MKYPNSLAVAVAVLFCFFTNVTVAKTQEEKQIQQRATQEQDQLTVNINPHKKTYQVDESIRFIVSGNKTFYLYLFSVDENNQNALMIFPNKDHTGNKFRIGEKIPIPNKSVEFYSDSAGKEKVVAIASTQYLPWDTSGYSAAGKFVKTDLNSFKTQTKAFVVRSRKLENDYPTQIATQIDNSETELYVRSPFLHIQEAYVDVKGKTVELARISVETPESVVVSDNKYTPIVYSGTDKRIYNDGEKVEILVGANKQGILHLYTAEPDGDLVYLTQKKVDGKGHQSVNAQATYPFGVHALVVAYSENGDLDDSYLKSQFKKQSLIGQSMNKGLTLISKPEPIPYSVTEFRINP